MQGPLIGVLALQGAFEEHQKCLEAIGCRTIQVRTPDDLNGLDGVVLPGGESTAMGLIGTSNGTGSSGTNNNENNKKKNNMWECLREFSQKSNKPTWGTCAGMILLAEKCVGTSAVIENGQSLIGGVDITVCRNYFGSQVSSFEMPTPAPPSSASPSSIPSSSATTTTTDTESTKSDDEEASSANTNTNSSTSSFPGVFIRAPAILTAGTDVQVLGKVFATPCRQAAATLCELERKINAGDEDVIQMGVVVDAALDRTTTRSTDHHHLEYRVVVKQHNNDSDMENEDEEEEKKEGTVDDTISSSTGRRRRKRTLVQLPGAAEGSNAREVICAVRKNNLLCTAFHPELTDDYRWHEYFMRMVQESEASSSSSSS